MAKEPIEKNDLYHLTAHIAEALKDYGAIRYLDSNGEAHVLLVVDEVSLNPGGDNSDRLVRLNPEFVTVEKEEVKI